MKYAIIDINNLVHRAKHVISSYESFDACVALTLTILFGSLRKTYDKFGADHCVACFDSRSWRKDVFPEYKGDREKDQSPIKLEEREIINGVLDSLKDFLSNHTNVTVLSAHGIEADDFVARWVQLHDDTSFEHIIVSADGDFKQLVRHGVELFNPIQNLLYTTDGVYFQDGNKPGKLQQTVTRHGETWKVKCKKKSDEPEMVEPEWELFETCIRGRKNNLRTAWPRVTTKKMREAFDDRGGPVWNDFINAIWGEEDRRQYVRKRYDFNRHLLDLRLQPQHVIDKMDHAISEAIDIEPKTMIGAWFAKFCSSYKLVKLVDQSAAISRLLASRY
jgi:hypothetical protein